MTGSIAGGCTGCPVTGSVVVAGCAGMPGWVCGWVALGCVDGAETGGTGGCCGWAGCAAGPRMKTNEIVST